MSWAGISWPQRYGGRGLSDDQQIIWYEEYAHAGAPSTLDVNFVSQHHAGPTLIALGSDAQALRMDATAAEALPDSLEATAWSDDGMIMAMRHRAFPVEGVQFHPESVGTPAGHALLRNFLESAGVPVAVGA